MTKYRSREIVEAVQWFPGVKCEGVHELKDGRAIIEGKEWRSLMASFGGPADTVWAEIKPGATVVTWREPSGEITKRVIVSERAHFDAAYEDIGG